VILTPSPSQEIKMNEIDQESVETLVATANQEAAVEEIEADALAEALDTIAKAMNKKDAEPKKDAKQVSLFDDEMPEDEDMDDEDMDDEDMDDEDMEKALKMYGMEQAMKAMAEGTDRIVGDMEKRMNAVLKGMEAMLSEMKAMKMEQGKMAKSLSATMSAPVPPRAVTHAPVADVAPSAPVASRGEMIRKALTKLQDANTDAPTRYRLRSAIAQLESGAPLSEITDFIG
jgi:hypothetical protein